jgi:hypothetical protein
MDDVLMVNSLDGHQGLVHLQRFSQKTGAFGSDVVAAETEKNIQSCVMGYILNITPVHNLVKCKYTHLSFSFTLCPSHYITR